MFHKINIKTNRLLKRQGHTQHTTVNICATITKKRK